MLTTLLLTILIQYVCDNDHVETHIVVARVDMVNTNTKKKNSAKKKRKEKSKQEEI